LHSLTLRRVLSAAFSAVHSRQNFHIQERKPGSRLGFSLSAWSLRHSDLSRMRGAAGDDHA
jgi:hypothetical protein